MLPFESTMTTREAFIEVFAARPGSRSARRFSWLTARQSLPRKITKSASAKTPPCIFRSVKAKRFSFTNICFKNFIEKE